MKRKIGFVIFLSALLLFAFASCKKNKVVTENKITEKFEAGILNIHDNQSVKKLHGQVLYLPVYSNIPYFEKGRKFDLSAFVAVHNTDFSYPIRITKVHFFDNDGNLVSNYLPKDTLLKPLATIDFFVPERDQSGTGANFILEWVSDSLVNEPLIESVIVGLSSGQGVSFLSTGKIVRELK